MLSKKSVAWSSLVTNGYDLDSSVGVLCISSSSGLLRDRLQVIYLGLRPRPFVSTSQTNMISPVTAEIHKG